MNTQNGDRLITQPPTNTTAALGTNATFHCRGNGEIHWKVNDTEITDLSLIQDFEQIGIYTPLPKDTLSSLIVTATEKNNHTHEFRCLINTEESEKSQLLVYGECRMCP